MSEAEQVAPTERSLLQYSVADDGVTWAQRVDEAAKYLESHVELPREPLDRVLVNKQIVPVDDRIEYLRRAVHSKRREFLLNNGRPAKFTRTGPIEAGNVDIRGSLAPESSPLWEIRIHFKGLQWDRREPAFAALGDLLGAYVGHTSPAVAASTLAAYSMAMSPQNAMAQAAWYKQASPFIALLNEQGIELPALAMLRSERLREAPWQPDNLGWINYWSAQTCEYLGFPQAGRDDDVLRWSVRTPAGAWIVKITPEPLDVSNVEHMRTLANLYARLPRLGVRLAV